MGGGEIVGQRRDWDDCREGAVAISPTSSQQRLEGRRTFGGMKPVGELVLSAGMGSWCVHEHNDFYLTSAYYSREN